jgi:putative ABC transport system permease protein
MLLTLVAPARTRGRQLSLLRTLGLSHRQARRLLLTELLPAVALALVTGAAAGTAIPLLLDAGLHLGEFTGGTPYRVAVDPGPLAALATLMTAVIAVGVLVQASTNRRHGLGRAHRVE